MSFKAFLDQSERKNQGITNPKEMIGYEIKEIRKITDKRVDVLGLQGRETVGVSNNDMEKMGELFQMDEMLEVQDRETSDITQVSNN